MSPERHRPLQLGYPDLHELLSAHGPASTHAREPAAPTAFPGFGDKYRTWNFGVVYRVASHNLPIVRYRTIMAMRGQST